MSLGVAELRGRSGHVEDGVARHSLGRQGVYSPKDVIPRTTPSDSDSKPTLLQEPHEHGQVFTGGTFGEVGME